MLDLVSFAFHFKVRLFGLLGGLVTFHEANIVATNFQGLLNLRFDSLEEIGGRKDSGLVLLFNHVDGVIDFDAEQFLASNQIAINQENLTVQSGPKACILNTIHETHRVAAFF